MKDIARLANVSTTTVSRVINNKNEGVSEATRNRILKIIEDSGYQPNSIAKGLVTKRTKTIGLIMPDITNPFYPDIARGVEDGAAEEGYSTFFCNTDDHLDREKAYIKVLKDKYIDGVILTASSISENEHILDLIKSNIPVVVMDREVESNQMYGVFLDNYKGGYLATKYLIDLGHRKIGCITGPLFIKNAKDRLEGYKRALLDAGIEINEELILEGDYKVESGINLAESILNKKDVTAIFACNDLMAYGVYRATKKLNIKIPDDISIVGFDDIELSQIVEPQLTTIRQPSYEMGLSAARLLIKLINGKKPKKRILQFQPELIVRQSTVSIGK